MYGGLHIAQLRPQRGKLIENGAIVRRGGPAKVSGNVGVQRGDPNEGYRIGLPGRE